MGRAPGDAVTLRERWRGRLVAARPVRVVADEPEGRIFCLPAGTRWKDDPRDLGEVRFLDSPWTLQDRVAGRPVLSFAFPDAAYAVLVTWTPEHRIEEYYVNLQTPLRAWEGGFDYVDHFLDVRIAADRSSWAWKDEDELDEAVRRGLLDRGEAEQIREWGERAVEHVIGARPPFDRDWNDWRPDPAWPVPELAVGWDHETADDGE